MSALDLKRGDGGGVYVIINTVTWVYYVGSARDFYARWVGNHRGQLRRGKHENPYLQASFTTHGEDAFVFLPVEHTAEDERLAAEQRWIDAALDVGVRIYNAATVAALPPSWKGKKRIHSDETKAKIAKAGRGRAPWNKGAKGLAPPHKGGSWGEHTSEAREKIRRAGLGHARPVSMEARAKISATMIERGTSRGTSHPRARLTDEIVRAIRAAREAGETLREIGERHGLSDSHVSNIATRKTWGHVE